VRIYKLQFYDFCNQNIKEFLEGTADKKSKNGEKYYFIFKDEFWKRPGE